jgi:hypothetical protein
MPRKRAPGVPAARPASSLARLGRRRPSPGPLPPARWGVRAPGLQSPSEMMARLVLVSLVVMGMSQTIAKEKIFEPLRDRLGGKETWLGYLVSCPYCLSHWIAFVLVPLTGAYALHVAPRWPIVSPVLDWFLSSILVTVIAAFFRVAFWFVDESQALVRTKKRVERAIEEEHHEANANQVVH